MLTVKTNCWHLQLTPKAISFSFNMSSRKCREYNSHPGHIISAIYRCIREALHLYNTRAQGCGGRPRAVIRDGRKSGGKLAEQVRGFCLLSFIMAIFSSHMVVSIFCFYFFNMHCHCSRNFHFPFLLATQQPPADGVKYLAKKEIARLPKGFYVSVPHTGFLLIKIWFVGFQFSVFCCQFSDFLFLFLFRDLQVVVFGVLVLGAGA